MTRPDGVLPVWWRTLAWPEWRLALTPIVANDAAMVARAVTDEIARGIGLASLDQMRDGTAVWASEAGGLATRGDAYRYRIDFEGRFAGVIELRRDAYQGHLGYWLRRAERGRGVATRSAYIAARVCFDGIGLRAIDVHVHPQNEASIAVVRRLGGAERPFGVSIEPNDGASQSRCFRIRKTALVKLTDGPKTLFALVGSDQEATSPVESPRRASTRRSIAAGSIDRPVRT